MEASSGQQACSELVKWYQLQYDVSISVAIRLIRQQIRLIKTNG